jgi:hypothetical protein
MTDVRERLDVVRAAGQLGLDLLECETPPLSWTTPERDDGMPIFEEDDRYWSAWNRILDLLDDFSPPGVDITEWDEEVPFMSAHTYRYVDGKEFATVGVNYGADGSYLINIQFNIEDGWHASINDHRENLTALDIGRKIGAAELAVLAHELQSPAETLDYWMTDMLYAGSQSAWAADRQASRQTVSDRVRAARNKLAHEDA